ncbi:MAG: ribonuclease P protein component [Acidimicrobiaceae bacterium]|nr:ribonuclease P protein component [Acidimicrobiaceae bacterium]
MPGRVSTRRQFAEFATPTGRGQSGSLRVLFVEHSNQGSFDVAYAISRKVGNAVVRNRIRRRLRAVMDSLSPAPKTGLYLIKCGNGTGELTYDEIQQHLQVALARARAV